MTAFLNFLADYHILFIIISIILIFALIGYFVQKRRRKSSPFKITNENEAEELNIVNMNNVDNNVSLSDALNKNATIKNNNPNINNVNNNSPSSLNNQSQS